MAREVLEETGVRVAGRPVRLGIHEHEDGLGRPARSHFFRVAALDDLPRAWEHAVSGQGEDAGLVFECRFEPAPQLPDVQSVFLGAARHDGEMPRGPSSTS